jgi:LysR family glycine cleavage system transcriptional activator
MPLRPPLNALHVFCVVAREGGFRQAAQALHLTPGAVSRQIRTLEERLGQVLFDRGTGNSATPTLAGRQLHDRVAARMADIVAALDTAGRARRRASIVVDTSVTLAMHWLIPQLPAFRQRHPDIHVQVRTTDGPINPAAPVDVFLRRDAAELRGLPARVFMAERSVLAAGPAFRPARASRSLRWLAGVPRIGTRSRQDLWPGWTRAHGLDPEVLAPTLEFDNTVLAIQAALQGLGVLVVPEAFIAAMLDSGGLKLMHAARVETGTYSFAVGRKRASARVDAFTAWLEERGGV